MRRTLLVRVALFVVVAGIPAAGAPRALGPGASQAPCVAARRLADSARLTYAPNRPDAILSASVDEPVVGIGIDDGPDAIWTPRMLAILARHRATATFFVVGENARQHPELLEAIAAAGHEVALHSYSHEPVEGRSPDDVSADLQATARAVRDAGIEPASLFARLAGSRTSSAPRPCVATASGPSAG